MSRVAVREQGGVHLAGGEVFYLLGDHLGSTSAALDEEAGKIDDLKSTYPSVEYLEMESLNNMKLYHFESPENSQYAQATRRGTWYPAISKICPECNTSRQSRISPLIIEWESGSAVIGDFVWPGLNTELVVVQKVKDVFQLHFEGIDYKAVEFWENPRLTKPAQSPRKTKPRVMLPYTSPLLWDVGPINWCHLDHQLSGVSIAKKCSTCGKVIYKTPPWHLRHLVVDPKTWNGVDIFHIHEYSGAIFCTEQVVELVKKSRFTNVNFLEDGEIPS